MNKKNKKGFTLAEVLITLTIIGVVAALTIPSLLADIADKTYVAKRKAFQVRLTQAISQIGSLNAYEDEDDPEANSGMKFVTEALSKVYKISNVCEFENFTGCDFAPEFRRWSDTNVYYTKNLKKLASLNGNRAMIPANTGGLDVDAVALRTKNGESMLLWYNPRCVAEQFVANGEEKRWTEEICATMLIDIDGGSEGPNAMGKDIIYGIVLYPNTPYLVLVTPNYCGEAESAASFSTDSELEIDNICANYTAFGLAKGAFTVPTREQIYAIYAIYGYNGYRWSSTIEGSGAEDYGWMVGGAKAKLAQRTTISGEYMCIQKDSLR